MPPRNTRRFSAVIVLSVFCVVGLFGCNQKTELAEPATRSIEAIADEYVAAMLERNPTLATYYDLPDSRHDRLYDNSIAALAAWQAQEDKWLAELDKIGEPTEIGSRDWVTFGILREELAASAATRICRAELWQASQFTAWHNGLPFVFEIQKVECWFFGSTIST